MGQGSQCAFEWYAGTERRGGTRPGACDGVEHDLVLATPHLKTVRICEFSSAIAADDLGADQVVAEPLVRDVRRSGARQKICCLQGCSLAESLVGRRQVQKAPSNQ
jgi:hypothetical protein